VELMLSHWVFQECQYSSLSQSEAMCNSFLGSVFNRTRIEFWCVCPGKASRMFIYVQQVLYSIMLEKKRQGLGGAVGFLILSLWFDFVSIIEV